MKQMVYSTSVMKVGSWGEPGGQALGYSTSDPHSARLQEGETPRARRDAPTQYLCPTTARKPAAPFCPKTQAQSPTSQPRDPLLLMYRRKVGLFHLLQQDTQGLQVQNDIVGFLQACVEQEQGLIPTRAETGPHP